MSKSKKKLADAVFEHYVKPYAENETTRKMRKIVHHQLTCGDLSHGHGIVKVSWSRPNKTAPKSNVGDE